MERQINQAVILCGGLGARLGDLTKEIPKPLVPILGKPTLDYIIDHLHKHGITEFVLAAGHLGDKIIEHYRNAPIKGYTVTVVIEPKPLGTAGAIEYCHKLLHEDFVVAYGDVMIDFDVSSLIKTHQTHNPIATLAIWESDYISDPHTHIVELDSRGVVTDFITERVTGVAYQNHCNAAVYVCNIDILNSIDTTTASDFGRDVFPNILSWNGPIQGHIIEPTGFVKDMGTPSRLVEVEALLKAKQP